MGRAPRVPTLRGHAGAASGADPFRDGRPHRAQAAPHPGWRGATEHGPAGCGGISLGFLTAGFTPVASVESDPWAAASHGANFGLRSHGGDRPALHVSRDVTAEDAARVFADLGLDGPVDDQVDVLVGGPPCQAFARVGRAKLREQAQRRQEETADQAFLVDGRVSLWQRYVAFIRATKPVALLMENVPDILNHGGTNVAELVCRSLVEEG